jgi:hypothetical protein
MLGLQSTAARVRWLGFVLALLAGVAAPLIAASDDGRAPAVATAPDDAVAATPIAAEAPPDTAPALLRQTQAEADAKSTGCLSCHQGIEPMHASEQVKLGCIDCHGGNAGVQNGGATPGSPEYARARDTAHVLPKFPEKWRDAKNPDRLSSANPERTYTPLNLESHEFVRFKNPGDLRVASETCGSCHVQEVARVQKSLMTTSSMLWGGAAYNNGIVPVKRYIFGESYGPDGRPQKISTVPAPTDAERARGVLPFLVPLPPWNVVQPPDPLRAFERGG